MISRKHTKFKWKWKHTKFKWNSNKIQIILFKILPIYSPTYLHSPTYLSTYLPTNLQHITNIYLPTYLPTYHQHIIHIFSDKFTKISTNISTTSYPTYHWYIQQHIYNISLTYIHQNIYKIYYPNIHQNIIQYIYKNIFTNIAATYIRHITKYDPTYSPKYLATH